MKKFKAAVIGFNSGTDKDENIKKLSVFIEKAAKDGAEFVSMPESAVIIDKNFSAENIPGETTEIFSKMAKRLNIFIHIGSIFEKNENNKPYNTSILMDKQGEIVAKYRKIHLFDADIKNGVNFNESKQISPGNEIINIRTEFGNFGFTICYDLRFPELFRKLTVNGAEIILVPSNFTEKTGEAHFETLLKARAVENSCYIIAAAQYGENALFKAYGKSFIINPWGEVIAKTNREGYVLADIDLEFIKEVRRQIPVIKNRRNDLY